MAFLLWARPAACGLCLMLAACGSARKTGITAFVSPDAVALAGARLDSLRATPFYRKLEQENRLPRLSQISSPAIHELLLSSDGQNVLAIARGADPAGSPYKGFTLYGDPASVQAAIKQYESGRPASPRALTARADAVPADAQIWAVTEGFRGATPDQVRALGNFGNLDRMLRLVEGASLSLGLRAGVHAVFAGDARNEQDAKTLADSLRGLTSLARMGVSRGAARNQPDLLHAFDAIEIKQDGRAVRLNFNIPEDLAEKLVK